MRKTVLVLAASFFTFCSGVSLAYAVGDDEGEKAGTIEFVATTDNEDSGLVFDEETDLHIFPRENVTVDDSSGVESSVKDPELTNDEVQVKAEDIPYLLLNLKMKKLALLEEKNSLLKEQNSLLKENNQTLSMMLLRKVANQKAKEEEQKKAKEKKPMSESARHMFL